ncbi:YciI family protein [Polynucleobacter sinensis]|jgi:uncharacterized protein YciI|uniref:YciI family protein n=1 Tax=Polynucleobacter sinensis TaxID=1743157 RepID=UPI000783CF62|nr:YciI family protein [Polynucleobacter sinensis]
MIFAIWLKDRPGTAQLRTEIRPVHRAYLEKMSDRIAFAGPLTSDDGKTTLGSLLVMEFSSRSEVEHWLKEEPFIKAGVYEEPIVHVFSNLWQQKVGYPSV